MRILIIEDDKRLTYLMRKVLEAEKFSVDIAHDGDLGVEIALRGSHDIAIVDWMLPGRDGPSICQAIRSARIPMAILMLTARTQVEDRVAGLYSGADDYLGKPFSFDELIARLYALGRRFNQNTVGVSELRVGNLVMDLRSHTARRGNQPLELTPTEWSLLEYLMRHPNQVLSRQKIVDYVWSYERNVQLTLVDVYISYLRNKLNQSGMKDPIQTRRGAGYRLVPENA
ncbi:MAG: response regulator transcription factor [Anaerolineales bacterium]|jgi:two-component system OmpR family response regulator